VKALDQRDEIIIGNKNNGRNLRIAADSAKQPANSASRARITKNPPCLEDMRVSSCGNKFL